MVGLNRMFTGGYDLDFDPWPKIEQKNKIKPPGIGPQVLVHGHVLLGILTVLLTVDGGEMW